MQQTCPSHDQWQALMQGTVDPHQLDALTSHLDACQSCKTSLDQIATTGFQNIDIPRTLGTSTDPHLSVLVSGLLDGEYKSTALGPSLDFLDEPEQPGELGTFAGYRILELLGHGGMGIVFRAFDKALQRTIALKVARPQFLEKPHAAERFLREARHVASIEDDYVVTVHSVSEWNHIPYLTMTYVSGETLQQQIKQHGTVAADRAVRVAYQTALGLAAAHAKGIVHCDVKPSNILIERATGRALLTDFGLARALRSDNDKHNIAGTPEFMSPEQARGLELDSRSDLFSLGSVLYAMLSGNPPFQGGDSAEVVRKVVETEPPTLANAPPELVRIVERLHKIDREQRYRSAAEVARDLRALPSEAPKRRWPAGVTVLASAVLLVAIGYSQLPEIQGTDPTSGENSRVSKASERAPVEQSQGPEKQKPKQARASYRSYTDALRAGMGLVRNGDRKQARLAFEEAVAMAKDDPSRILAYRQLIPIYSNLKKMDDKLYAAEFVLAKSSRPAERLVIGRELLEFFKQRGKIDWALRRYERTVQSEPNDLVALEVLARLYSRYRPDPARAVTVLERLRKQLESEGKQFADQETLAGQYVKSGELETGAMMYEAVARRDSELSAWCWMEAACAWQKAGKTEKSLAAATESLEGEPESRSKLLTHYWHKQLADLLLKLEQNDWAAEQYERAIETTAIEGYLAECRRLLQIAKNRAADAKNP